MQLSVMLYKGNQLSAEHVTIVYNQKEVKYNSGSREAKVVPGHPKGSFLSVRNSSCGKVMFSQTSVILSTGVCVRGEGRGMCCEGGCAWQKGVCVARGAYVAKGRAWQGHAWQDRRPLQRTECSGMHPCIGTKATLLPDGLTENPI